MEALKLFAVLLGGNPTGAGVEVHDVVFAVGPSIEAVGDQLRAAWFDKGGTPHIDSWMVLDTVDGAGIEVATASTISPNGSVLAGTHGLSLLSLAASSPSGWTPG